MQIPGVSFLRQWFIMDNSPRTTAISRPTWVTIGALVMIVVCVFWAIAGCQHYNTIQKNSSTPIGSIIKFSRSSATMTLSGLYTDKNQDVLVARLTPDSKTNSNLPYRGKDFTVLVQSDATKNYEELPILFGKMGTDGDYMLVIPKPTNKVYSFVLVDSSSQARQLDMQTLGSTASVDKEQSVARALSDFNKELMNNPSQDLGSAESTAATGYDMAGFRMTMDPYAEGAAYQPTVVNAELLNPSTNEFNFEAFYQDVFIEAAVTTLTREYNQLEAQAAQAEANAEAQEIRLNANPADGDAARNLRESQRQADDLNRQKERKAAELTAYQTMDYDPGLFQDFQDTAIVIA